jgi:hypothetical protein
LCQNHLWRGNDWLVFQKRGLTTWNHERYHFWLSLITWTPGRYHFWSSLTTWTDTSCSKGSDQPYYLATSSKIFGWLSSS